jgi:hypothetical protein
MGTSRRVFTSTVISGILRMKYRKAHRLLARASTDEASEQLG